MSNSQQLLVLKSGWMDRLESQAEEFIQIIPQLGDEQLLDVYRQVLRIGNAVWLIECATSYEMLERAVKKRGGRGLVDDDETGAMATARKIANQFDIAPRTVFVAAQIHQEFFASETIASACNSFEAAKELGKNFFQIAVETSSPPEALRSFWEAKKENPDFSVRDAKRMVAAGSAPNVNDVIWDGLETEDRKAAWDAYQRAWRAMRAHFPWLREGLGEHMDSIKEQLSQPSITIRQAILDAIDQGFATIEDFAERLGKPREFIKVWLDRMVDAGELKVKPGERKEGARGAVANHYYENKSPARG